jgi:HK97 gp10 family phage protein
MARSSAFSVVGGSGVKVFGVAELLAKLEGINRIARIHVGFMMGAAAEFIKVAAIAAAPERTGNLKTSILASKVGPYTWKVVADTTTGSDPGGEGKNAYEYAGYVEYGTSRTPAQPFMAPAVKAGEAEIAVSLRALAAEIQAL